MSIPTFKIVKDILLDEKNCINFLFENNILYKLNKCSYCQSKLNREANLYRCINRKCHKSISIFKDSFFAKNHLKCSDSLLIAYLWLCKNSYSSIMTITGHSSSTITNYIKYFRELIISTLDDDDTIIGGENIIIEVDESKFGHKKYHRGRNIEGVWIIAGIERTEEKKCFIEIVENRNADTIQNVLSKHVAQGSIVYTDSWKGYNGIEEMGIYHKTVNHSNNFVDPFTGVHTNTIEGLWNSMKLQIKPVHRNKRTIENHLFEFIWRKRNYSNLWKAFINALSKTGYFE